MNTSAIKFSSALFLSGLFFASSAFAQAQSADRTADDRAAIQPVDPTDDGVWSDDDNRSDEDSARREADPLELTISGHDFHVTGGTAGGLVVIVIGLDRAALTLPGGAHLMLYPLAILASGEFGADGTYNHIQGYDGKSVQPIEYHFQAFAEGADGFLKASGLRTLDFRPSGGTAAARDTRDTRYDRAAGDVDEDGVVREYTEGELSTQAARAARRTERTEGELDEDGVPYQRKSGDGNEPADGSDGRIAGSLDPENAAATTADRQPTDGSDGRIAGSLDPEGGDRKPVGTVDTDNNSDIRPVR